MKPVSHSMAVAGRTPWSVPVIPLTMPTSAASRASASAGMNSAGWRVEVSGTRDEGQLRIPRRLHHLCCARQRETHLADEIGKRVSLHSPDEDPIAQRDLVEVAEDVPLAQHRDVARHDCIPKGA